MFDMILHSSRSFFAGTLFQDNAKVVRQLIVGIVVGAVVVVLVGQLAPAWVAALAGGAAAGLLQPLLFKDLKYA